MTPVLPIPFAKTEAHGNDFLIVSEEHATDAPSELTIAMCDRLRGIGADGLIVYRAANDHLVMTLFNRDGSSAEISGNGARCLAAYLTHAGLVSGPEIEIETGVEIDMAIAIVIGEPTILATTLSMGNPHCVVFTAREALAKVGPLLESHAHFPDRTNVELVEVVDRHTIRIAIWERGAGETASSGTGSSASAVAAIVNSHVESPVAVHCPGGALEVEWTEGESVFLTGDAVVVAEGNYWRRS